jgi:hypothetical protein
MSKYEIKGPVGAVGDNAAARDFKQTWSQSGIDISKLAKQLWRLRNAMNGEHERTPEQDKAFEIELVDKAMGASSKGDGPTALRYLKTVGGWTLDIAEKIGVELVVEAIKKAGM